MSRTIVAEQPSHQVDDEVGHRPHGQQPTQSLHDLAAAMAMCLHRLRNLKPLHSQNRTTAYAVPGFESELTATIFGTPGILTVVDSITG